MKRRTKTKPTNAIPKDAVLLIPDPEEGDASSAHGIKPGCYTAKQMLELVNEHKSNADAIYFISDMLETGDAENDGFADMLRNHRENPVEIARIVKLCSS